MIKYSFVAQTSWSGRQTIRLLGGPKKELQTYGNNFCQISTDSIVLIVRVLLMYYR